MTDYNSAAALRGLRFATAPQGDGKTVSSCGLLMMASGEDDLIARYFRPLATDPGALGLVDDAALLKSSGDDLVVTTDAIVEGVHFLAALGQRHLACLGQLIQRRRGPGQIAIHLRAQ